MASPCKWPVKRIWMVKFNSSDLTQGCWPCFLVDNWFFFFTIFKVCHANMLERRIQSIHSSTEYRCCQFFLTSVFTHERYEYHFQWISCDREGLLQLAVNVSFVEVFRSSLTPKARRVECLVMCVERCHFNSLQHCKWGSSRRTFGARVKLYV